MTDQQTITLLSALAAGCDPATGKPFGPTHVLRRKEVTQALNTALKALGAPPAKRPRRPIMGSDHFKGKQFNKLSAKSRRELADRVLALPMEYPLNARDSRVKRTVDARAREPWKPEEQELLARVLPHTNDLKFLSIVFQRSEKAIGAETRRLLAEREALRHALAGPVTQG